jgi:hypothetical protein
MKLLSCIFLLFLAFTYFGHPCDHLQGVPQYKYQKYNRNNIKCIIKLSNFYVAFITDRVLGNIAVPFIRLLSSHAIYNVLHPKGVTEVSETCKC